MAQPTALAKGDYVLGTQDVEIERLGLQHLVWRPPGGLNQIPTPE